MDHNPTKQSKRIVKHLRTIASEIETGEWVPTRMSDEDQLNNYSTDKSHKRSFHLFLTRPEGESDDR